MTKQQALKEARAILCKHGLVKPSDVNGRTVKCSGQMMVAGSKVTCGCGHRHLQPCPGGPMVYEIHRLSGIAGMVFRCIEAYGESWADAIEDLKRRKKR